MTQRCAACGAALTAGAPWCSLCFTPTAAAPSPPSAPPGPVLPPPTTPPVAPPPTTPPVLPPPVAPALPTPVAPALPPPSTPPVTTDPDAWVALLAAEERRNRSSLLSGAPGRGRRTAIIIGGAVAVIAVLAVVTVLLSLVAG